MSTIGNRSGAIGELDNLSRKFLLRQSNGLKQRLCGGGVSRFGTGKQRLLPQMLLSNAPKCTQ
jgi:hypothetical protein